MRCIRPLKAGFDRNGDITYSSRQRDPALVGFEFECRKCLPCRLNLAREKAIRCWHQSKYHENNIFLTLTYNEKSLESPRLNYEHFQEFIAKLRESNGREPENRITYMVTGEYGEKNKRPHWHAIIFNYSPKDGKLLRTTEREEKVFRSETVERLWDKGNTEYGEVTIDSAGYVARYAAKKLVHGRDQEHDYHPIHKTSSKRAIGRSWIEENYLHTFENGFIVGPDGQQLKIPRYYVDWAKKHHPTLWEHYVTEVRPEIMKGAERKEKRELDEYMRNRDESPFAKKKCQIKLRILESKFKQLQEKLKL